LNVETTIEISTGPFQTLVGKEVIEQNRRLKGSQITKADT